MPCGPSVLPERQQLRLIVGPASPCAWSTCVTRKAPLVSDSSEDEQKMAGALEAVSLGPSQEAPPLPASVPRCARWGGHRSPALCSPGSRLTLLP